MLSLIVGPSGAGKSTYIRRAGFSPVYFASKLRWWNFPKHGYIHYNLLHHAFAMRSKDKALPDQWDLLDEPTLAKLISSKSPVHVTILVAPAAELVERASERSVVEKGVGPYPSAFWYQFLKKVDLAAVYVRLFAILESRNIPYDVLYSSEKFDDFLPSSACRLSDNLAGRYAGE